MIRFGWSLALPLTHFLSHTHYCSPLQQRSEGAGPLACVFHVLSPAVDRVKVVCVCFRFCVSICFVFFLFFFHLDTHIQTFMFFLFQCTENNRRNGKERERKQNVNAQYIHIEYLKISNPEKQTESSNSESNNNKLTFFAAFTSNGEKREKHLNIKST